MNRLTRLLIPLLLASASSVCAALSPANLRTEWLPNPLGIDAEKPRLSWRVEESDATVRGQKQTAFRVLVASSAEDLAKNSGDLWDSGKVQSDETLNLEYAGKPLESGRGCFWKVKVWDKDGVGSAWSAGAQWSMGLLKPEDWKAQWISFKDDAPLHTSREKLLLPPARHYRKDFQTKGEVKRAMLYMSALGIADLYLDGAPVSGAQPGMSAEYFAPGWSDYRERAYYRAYDLSWLLGPMSTPSNMRSDAPRKHTLGAVVADGWYAGYVGYGLLVGYGPNKTGRNIYGKIPALLVQLQIEYQDGSREIIGTDATWQTSGDGPYREADLHMGESYDATRESSIWCIPAYQKQAGSPPDPVEAWKWEPAIPAEQNGSMKATFSDTLGAREVELGFQKPKRLTAYTAPPIRTTQGMRDAVFKEIKPGIWIFDFGQNFAGNVILSARAQPGTKVTLRYGEMLHPDGSLMTENLRRARATDIYIVGAAGAGRWSPRFTYHGFRYVEVTGLSGKPDDNTLVGQVIHNGTAPAGEFKCSDPVMTQFWKNTEWTQRANFIEVPTDCPQRDERLGWMGDAQIYARTATYNADVAAFFTKWIDDVREAQRESGAYPDYAPYPFAHGAPGATHGTAWTDAGVIVPYTMWQVYGDTRLLAKHWDSMVKFMDWRAKADPELKGVKIGNTWGDWLNVNEETPIAFVDLCYHYRSANMMMFMAYATDRDSMRFSITADKLRRSFQKQYVNPDGSLTVKTQTAYVLALENGLFFALNTPRAVDIARTKYKVAIERDAHLAAATHLAERITSNDFRMSTGFLGTKPLLGVLSENGQHDLACRLFQSRKFPSWGYEVEQGATSVWERWDSFTKEHGFNGATGKNNAAMNSFSHYAFGAVMQWGFQTLAGIDTDGPGFKKIIIRPHIPSAQSNPDGQPLDWVRATYEHPRGKIASAWKRAGAKLLLDVTIPANTTASVHLPDGAVKEVGSGTHHFEVAAK